MPTYQCTNLLVKIDKRFACLPTILGQSPDVKDVVLIQCSADFWFLSLKRTVKKYKI